MKNSTLTLFYDGQCPLCIREMSQLKKLDKHGRLMFEDITTLASGSLVC